MGRPQLEWGVTVGHEVKLNGCVFEGGPPSAF